MGAWIEIMFSGETGLTLDESHPTMGAWIEIANRWISRYCCIGRTPRWVRGLKLSLAIGIIFHNFVAPHDGCVD